MRALTIPIVATVFVVAAMVYQAKTGEATLCVAPEVRLDALEGFTVEDVPVGEAELTVLPSDTGFVKRRYFNEAGPVIPGRNCSISRSSPTRASAYPGTSGRGPTKLMSPFSTFHNSGNSSILYLRSFAPSGVILDSPATDTDDHA